MTKRRPSVLKMCDDLAREVEPGSFLAPCPHCEQSTILRHLATWRCIEDEGARNEYTEPRAFKGKTGGGESPNSIEHHQVIACTQCGRVSILWQIENTLVIEGIPKLPENYCVFPIGKGWTRWPEEKDPAEGLPEKAAEYYRKARNQRDDPDAYGTQTRKALEALCDHFGILPLDASLGRRLKMLCELKDWGHALRRAVFLLLRACNRASHHGGFSLNRGDVNDLHRLFRFVVDTLFGVEDCIAKMESSFEKRKDQPDAQSSSC